MSGVVPTSLNHFVSHSVIPIIVIVLLERNTDGGEFFTPENKAQCDNKLC